MVFKLKLEYDQIIELTEKNGSNLAKIGEMTGTKFGKKQTGTYFTPSQIKASVVATCEHVFQESLNVLVLPTTHAWTQN